MGDSNNSGWIRPFHTGEIITQSHKWSKKGTYNIRCKSKGINNIESERASYQITMPRNKSVINSLLINFIKTFITNRNNSLKQLIFNLLL